MILDVSVNIVIYLCGLLILFSYVFYPLIIYITSLLFKEDKIHQHKLSKLSILVSAYNEEKNIKARLENIASQEYDLELIEVLVGSDSSTDKTNDYLLQLQDVYPWLKIFIYKQRRGKALVLNDLVKKAKHDILVFTDANTIFDKKVLTHLVSGFNSDNIGGVSGKLILTEPKTDFNKSVEEAKYWRYETFIKKAEGKAGVLIGANGGIFAIKKALYVDIPKDRPVTDDFFISLSVVSRGYKFIYNPDAFALEEVAKSVKAEFQRKIRFAATNFQTIVFFKNILFSKNILLSLAFWSHKIIRWFVPFFMVIIFILSFWNPMNHVLIYYIFIFQLIFYISAILGSVGALVKIRIPLFSLIYFFVLSNVALFIGFFRFVFRKHSLIWQTTPR